MINHVLHHFKKVDQVIYRQLVDMKLEPLQTVDNDSCYFEKLCQNIVGQQLSGKAADAIWHKFILLVGKTITPVTVLSFSETNFREVGLSFAKARYVRDLAEKILNHEVKLGGFDKMMDEEIIEELIKVKGIGRWTAEMFLIFTLGREDVFSFGDLGLKRGFIKLYGSIDNMAEITSLWSPYRSYASLALWCAIE